MIDRTAFLAALQLLLARFLAAQMTVAAGAPLSGPAEQALHLGPASFQAQTPSETFAEGSDGYFYGLGVGYIGWVAPLTLPEGAELTKVCLYEYDVNPGASIGLHLDAVKRSAQTGFVEHDVVDPVVSDFVQGYRMTCSGPLSYTYRESQDWNGDGEVDSVPHRLVISAGADNGGLGWGGVRLHWRLQVSPAPATATFNDVPTGHPFFQFVEALSASGITAGCGGGNFCPNAPLTRGQMAVFLSKALGLQWL